MPPPPVFYVIVSYVHEISSSFMSFTSQDKMESLESSALTAAVGNILHSPGVGEEMQQLP